MFLSEQRASSPLFFLTNHTGFACSRRAYSSRGRPAAWAAAPGGRQDAGRWGRTGTTRDSIVTIDSHDSLVSLLTNDNDQRVKWELPIYYIDYILTVKKTFAMDLEMKSAVDFLTTFLYDMQTNDITCDNIMQFDISIRTCRMTLTEIRRIVYRKKYRSKIAK